MRIMGAIRGVLARVRRAHAGDPGSRSGHSARRHLPDPSGEQRKSYPRRPLRILKTQMDDYLEAHAVAGYTRPRERGSRSER